MRHYELVVVLSPVLSQEDASGVWDRIKELINQHGGDISQEEQWGMRRLAYPIRRGGQTFLEGNYLLTRFSTDTVVPIELEAHLKLSQEVLRSLTVKCEPPKPAPPVPEGAVAAQAEGEELAVEAPVASQIDELQTTEVPEAEGEELAVEEPVASLTEELEATVVPEAEGEELAVEEPVASLTEELEATVVPEAEGEELAVEEPVASLTEELEATVVPEAEGEELPVEAPVASLTEELEATVVPEAEAEELAVEEPIAYQTDQLETEGAIDAEAGETQADQPPLPQSEELEADEETITPQIEEPQPVDMPTPTAEDPRE